MSPGARVINSVLQGDVTVATASVVQHCHLQVSMELYPHSAARTQQSDHKESQTAGFKQTDIIFLVNTELHSVYKSIF